MPVLVGDGLKVGKAGRKMPGVKKLHQESGSNTKPPFIMGHSCQAVGVIVRGLAGGFAALPLAARIHEGVVFSNRDKRTLLDKMIELLDALGMASPCYLVADAYYASGKVVQALLARGSHLVTRVRSNDANSQMWMELHHALGALPTVVIGSGAELAKHNATVKKMLEATR